MPSSIAARCASPRRHFFWPFRTAYTVEDLAPGKGRRPSAWAEHLQTHARQPAAEQRHSHARVDCRPDGAHIDGDDLQALREVDQQGWAGCGGVIKPGAQVALNAQKKGPQGPLSFACHSQSVPKTLPFAGSAVMNINEIRHLYGGSVEIRTLG